MPRISCFITFSGVKVRLTSLQFPAVPPSFFLEEKVVLLLHLLLHLLSSSHQVPLPVAMTVQRSLRVASALSLHAHGCIPSGSVDLCKSILLSYSLTCPSSAGSKTSLLQTFPTGVWSLRLLKKLIKKKKNQSC